VKSNVLRTAGVALIAFAVVAAVGTTVSAAPAKPGPTVSPSARAAESATALVSGRPAFLHTSARESFIQQKVVSSGNTQYVPYERTYAGLPVVGGDFVVVTNNAGQVLFNSVSQDTAIGNLATTPKVSSAVAANVAKAQLKTVTSVESTSLKVYAVGKVARLAYDTIVVGYGADGYSRLSVYVDAQNGKVLGTQEHVTEGTGTSGYSGTVTLATTQSGSTFSLRDPVTTNLSCQDAANNTTFSGPDDLWGNGNATSRETGCVDALFTAQTEVKMLSQWLGRNAMDGAGGAWPIRVGLADLNAFYDGTQVQVGHNQANQWIGSLDVVGHEMGHGVDDHTPGGISGSGTQEFVADTFGAATEWFANESAANDPPDFQVGEEINLVGSGPIRIMYNPSQVGDPNCYSSSIPSAEVHAAAGPGDHWFYLLAEGTNPTNGQPTSTTCNGSSGLVGVGIQQAMQVMYNAMLMKTTSSSYLKYRTWTLTAAKNLTPASCSLFNTVKAAWDAVSVPAQAADPTCTIGAGLALNAPGNQSGTVGSAASLSLVATGGTTPYTFSATGLPTGLSINASSGVISGTPSAAGTFSVTATVNDSASHTASQPFTWTISPVGSCSSPGQKIVNPGFESGNTPWTATAGVLGNTSGQTAHAGTKYAWLDGYGTTHTDTLQQSVTLPSGCSSYQLSFFLHIDSAETTTTTQFDKLTVTAGATTLATFSNLNKATGYTLRGTYNLAAFAGTTVVIKLSATEDSSLQTSFVVDDFALNVS
jgi:Zn-dependent metalloprotease